MFGRNNATSNPPNTTNTDTARIRATVDSQSRAYTDPAATYPRARQHQEQRLSGAARRRPS